MYFRKNITYVISIDMIEKDRIRKIIEVCIKI